MAESENPVIGTIRSTSETVRGWLFDETEVAQVTRLMRVMDRNHRTPPANWDGSFVPEPPQTEN